MGPALDLRLVQLAQIVAGGLAVLCPLFGIYAHYETSEKRRAWFLSLVIACFVAPRALYFHVSRFVFPFDAAAMHQSDKAADLNVGMFVAFLLADTCLGLRFYRSCFGLIEGWLHHVFYLAFFLFTFARGLTIGASTTFALEVPVVVLALGHCFPDARHDLLFGLTFFIFRIAYHAYLLYKWVHIHDPPYQFSPIIAATLVLHAHWFYKWTRGQRRRSRLKQNAAPLDHISAAAASVS